MRTLDITLRASVVRKILDGELSSALDSLSSGYGVSSPQFRVGTVKGHRNVAACYVEKQRIIVFANSEILCNPAVVLHEFYHHLVSQTTLKGAGTDKNAERFVKQFLSVSDDISNHHG